MFAILVFVSALCFSSAVPLNRGLSPRSTRYLSEYEGQYGDHYLYKRGIDNIKTGENFNFKTYQNGGKLFLDVDGKWKINNNHGLFGSLNTEKDFQDIKGTLKYLHKPSESDIQLNYGKSGQDLDLTFVGSSKVNGNGIHKLGGLASILRKNGEIFGEGNIDYHHKPTNTDLNFDVKSSKVGTDANLQLLSSLKDHDIKSKTSLQHKFGKPINFKTLLNYKHKPSGGDISLGVQNSESGTDIFVKGQKTFLNNDNHNIEASGTLDHKTGGATSLSTLFGYRHKPTGEQHTLDVLKGATNMKPGRKL